MASPQTPCLPSAPRPCGLQEGADLVSREALEAGSQGWGTGLRGDVEATCARRPSSCGRWARAQARGPLGASDLRGAGEEG